MKANIFLLLSTLAFVPGLCWAAPPKPAPKCHWATIQAKASEIDLIAYPAEVAKAIAADLDKYGQGAAHGPDTERLKKDPRLSGVFPIGQAWDVITKKGIVTLKITGYGVVRGPGEDHLLVSLQGSPAFAGLSGLAVPSGSTKSGLKLIAGAPVAGQPGTKTHATWCRKVLRAMKAKLTPAERKLLRKRPAKPAHTMAMSGSFGPKRRTLVSVSVPGQDGLEHVSALFFVDAQGKVVSFVDRPSKGLNAFSLVGVVDIDGDGVDEAVVESSYYEGSYTNLMYWDGEKFAFQVLTGDGA